MKQNPLLFLDTSVILAAVFSDRGGSSGIIELWKKRFLRIVITEAVVLESYRKIKKKYGSKELHKLEALLGELKDSIKPLPTKLEIKKFDTYLTDQDDRHILAGAKKYEADYLITLDKKHFFSDKLKQTKLTFNIHTPQMFLTLFRENYKSD